MNKNVICKKIKSDTNTSVGTALAVHLYNTVDSYTTHTKYSKNVKTSIRILDPVTKISIWHIIRTGTSINLVVGLRDSIGQSVRTIILDKF